MKKLTRVEIEWVDSLILADGAWSHSTSLKVPESAFLHRTAGILLRWNKRYAVVASSTNLDGTRAAGAIAIPRIAIVKYRVLGKRTE